MGPCWFLYAFCLSWIERVIPGHLTTTGQPLFIKSNVHNPTEHLRWPWKFNMSTWSSHSVSIETHWSECNTRPWEVNGENGNHATAICNMAELRNFTVHYVVATPKAWRPPPQFTTPKRHPTWPCVVSGQWQNVIVRDSKLSKSVFAGRLTLHVLLMMTFYDERCSDNEGGNRLCDSPGLMLRPCCWTTHLLLCDLHQDRLELL